MTEAIKISVCLTTWNRAEGLDRSLASLATQTRPPDEVIVSDDASTDHTEEVAARWAPLFARYRYHRNAANLGMPGNLNSALQLAGGQYVANLHDGDLYAQTLLEKWTDALDRYPTAGFVFNGIGGWPTATREGGGVILHDVAPFTDGREFFERYFLHQYSSIVWGTVMARRRAYDRLLPFDASIGFTSDVDMWMRMCLDHGVAYVREPLIVLDHSPTAERAGGQMNWRWVEMARRTQLRNIGRFFADDPPRLEREARRHRAAARRQWLRRMAGRVRHLDAAGLNEGMRLSSGFFRSTTLDGEAAG